MISKLDFLTLCELRTPIEGPHIRNVDRWIAPKTEILLSRGGVVEYAGWDFYAVVLKDEGFYYSQIFVKGKDEPELIGAISLDALIDAVQLKFGRK